MDHKLIGRRIATYRERRTMSQSELARRLDVTPQTVQKWEAGGAPRTHRIEAIATVLGVPASALVGDEAPADVSVAGRLLHGIDLARIERLDDVALAYVQGRLDEAIKAMEALAPRPIVESPGKPSYVNVEFGSNTSLRETEQNLARLLPNVRETSGKRKKS
jgi:transcriptional regulator with XRE-family HTH domain